MATKKEVFLEDIVKIAKNSVKFNTFRPFPIPIQDHYNVIHANAFVGGLAGVTYGLVEKQSPVPVLLCAIAGVTASLFYLQLSESLGQLGRGIVENIRNYNSNLEKRARKA